MTRFSDSRNNDPALARQQAIDCLRERLAQATLQCLQGGNFRCECAVRRGERFWVRQSRLIVHTLILNIRCYVRESSIIRGASLGLFPVNRARLREDDFPFFLTHSL